MRVNQAVLLQNAVAAMKASPQFSRQAIQARLAGASATLRDANEPSAPIAPDQDRKRDPADDYFAIAL